jgi:hypothetical protein
MVLLEALQGDSAAAAVADELFCSGFDLQDFIDHVVRRTGAASLRGFLRFLVGK